MAMGRFSPRWAMRRWGTTPIDIAAGDFNGDGRLDLAIGKHWHPTTSPCLLGKGNGTFEETTANVAGNVTIAVATGDFTGNGNLGLAVLNEYSDSVTILPGNGDGTFQQSLTIPLAAGGMPTSIVAADFNDDGRIDLAVADPILGEVDILLGNGDGTFESPTVDPGGGGRRTRSPQATLPATAASTSRWPISLTDAS